MGHACAIDRTIPDTVEQAETLDDHELVERAADGDREAFETLVRRHTPGAWRMASSMLRDGFAAEEAVQDTFLKAYRNLASFRGDARVSTWLLSICRRVCLDHLRRKRLEVVPLDEVAGVGSAPPDVALQIAFDAALARLPTDEREAFVIVEVLGFTREEAAEVIGTPASTMRSRVARARTKLARSLGGARHAIGESFVDGADEEG